MPIPSRRHGAFMRPKSIAIFEALSLLTLLVGAGQSALSWRQAITQAPPSFVLTVQGVTAAFLLAMVLFVSRGHSRIAKWVLVVSFGMGLPMVWKQFTSGQMLGFPVVTLLMTAVQFVALMMLFLPTAQDWFSKRREYRRI